MTSRRGTATVDVTVVTPQGTSAHGALDEYTYTFSNNGYSITLSASTASPAAGGSVVLTLNAKAQQAAYDGLANVDPGKAVEGAVVSNPTAKNTTSWSGFSVAIRNASRGE